MIYLRVDNIALYRNHKQLDICIKEEEIIPYKHPEAIIGHLYTYTITDVIFICVLSENDNKVMYRLKDGGAYNYNDTFGYSGFVWEDVTDKYCLTKK